MDSVPTPDEHAALLADMRHIGAEMPKSGAKDRAGKPYIPRRFNRRVEELADDPQGLVNYVVGLIERPVTEGFSKLAAVGRLDLAVESLVADESTHLRRGRVRLGRIYARHFDHVRHIAQERLDNWQAQIADQHGERKNLREEETAAVILLMNVRRTINGDAPLTNEQERLVHENRA